MKKMTTLIFLMLFLMTGCKCQAQAIEGQGVYQQLEKHTVKLYQVIKNNPPAYGMCTAVIVDKQENISMLFTAGHCVDKEEGFSVVLEDRPYFVIRKYISKYSDIAILFIEGNIESKEAVPLSTRRLNIGDKLYNFSYPESIVFKKEGNFLDENWYSGSVSFLVIPGCSGSGIYNEYGELEGIVISRDVDNPISYYIPVTEFFRFIRQLEIDGKLAKVKTG